MIQIEGRTANELFVNVAKRLLSDGKYVSPRGMKTLELNDVWLELENPRDSIVTLEERSLNMDYLEGELDWYLNGGYDVEEIGQHSKFWYGLQDSNGQVNSNYGQIALRDVNEHGVTQYDWCVDKLKGDPDTRQAVIVYNQPRHKDPDTKDFVCTLSQSFRINKGRLNSTTVMRSNDLIFGLSYDLPWFTHIQDRISDEVKVDIGKYNHFASSLHVYEKHFEMLEEISKAND